MTDWEEEVADILNRKRSKKQPETAPVKKKSSPQKKKRAPPKSKKRVGVKKAIVNNVIESAKDIRPMHSLEEADVETKAIQLWFDTYYNVILPKLTDSLKTNKTHNLRGLIEILSDLGSEMRGVLKKSEFFRPKELAYYVDITVGMLAMFFLDNVKNNPGMGNHSWL